MPEFDPAYVEKPFSDLAASYPGEDVYPFADFRVEWGPIFHRGRLDGTRAAAGAGPRPAREHPAPDPGRGSRTKGAGVPREARHHAKLRAPECAPLLRLRLARRPLREAPCGRGLPEPLDRGGLRLGERRGGRDLRHVREERLGE